MKRKKIKRAATKRQFTGVVLRLVGTGYNFQRVGDKVGSESAIRSLRSPHTLWVGCALAKEVQVCNSRDRRAG